MARLFDTETLQPVEIPDADAPAHILSGRYGLAAGTKVLLEGPDGKSYEMPAESAPLAFEKGYKFTSQGPLRSDELEEKYGAVGGKLLTAGTGIARGLSINLSDRVLRNLGVSAETLRLADEGNPVLSGVSQAAGAVIPLLMSGGTSTGAEVAGAIGAAPRAVGGLGTIMGKGAASALGLGGKSLLAKAGAKAVELGVSGAVEGAAYGAGQAMTEDALGRADLNAESLLANAGLGAAVGLGGGVLLGGGSVLAGAGLKAGAKFASEKLSSGSIREFLEDFAKESATRAALGRNKRAFKTLEGKDQLDEAGEYLLKKVGIDKLDNVESLAEKMTARVDELDAQRAKIVESLDEATASKPLERLSPRQVAAAIRQELLPNIDKEAQRSVYDAVERYADDLHASGNKGLSFSEAATKRAAAQKNANYDSANPGALREAWASIAGIWNNKIDKAADPVLARLGKDEAGSYKAVRDEMALAIRIRDYAQDRVVSDMANRRVSPSSYAFGAAMGLADASSGGAASLAKGAASSLLHQQVLERGNAFAANVAYKLSKLKGIQEAAQAVSKRMDSVFERIITGRRRDAGGRFVKPSPSIIKPAALQLIINNPLLPENAGSRPANRRVAAKQRSKELALLMADPSRVADRIAAATSGLDRAAPNIATQAVITATRALQYLHANAPKNPKGTDTMQPLLDDWEPSDQEASRFERRIKAAFDPLSVLDDLADGSLSKEGAETLRTLYPQLHQMTFQRLTEKLAEVKHKLSYEDRINLSLLFGVPVDETMQPDFIRRSQEGWAQKPSEGMGGGGQRVAGIDKMNLADNMRTSTQQREATR